MPLFKNKKNVLVALFLLLIAAAFWKFFRSTPEPSWLYDQSLKSTPIPSQIPATTDQLIEDMNNLDYDFLDQEFESLEAELDQIQKEF